MDDNAASDESKVTTIRIDLEPIGRRIEVEPGITLLEAAQKAGIDLVAVCGGAGICGTCRVRPLSGVLSPLSITETEHLTNADQRDGYRLACQAIPESDVRIEIPPETLPGPQRMQVEGQEGSTDLDPAVVPVDISVKPPTQEDLRSDFSRVREAVSSYGYPPLTGSLDQIDRLSSHLRQDGWKVRLAVRLQAESTKLVASFPPDNRLLGLAVDLGSTKLAVYLIDLETGATLASTGVMNPQISYGEDVVSRIAYANQSSENRSLLQSRLVTALNETISNLCEAVGAQAGQIVDAVVVGNTAMHHFFCRLPVTQLGAAPYVPAVSDPLDVPVQDIGLLIADGAQIHLPANIAGYVGGDHTAALLMAKAYSAQKTFVVVDIGTNTEISLVHDGRIVTCSCASGPAFEGAHIRDGMRAAPGAIERVGIENGELHVTTIASQPPIGICGTGILQAIAEMQRVGIIDSKGVIDRSHPDVELVDGKPAFKLVPAQETGHGRDILVTRRDVNEIQLAKAAIRVGIDILLDAAVLTADDVEEWIIAGAFGTYLDLASSVRIGMFPEIPLERFRQVGNAAGAGAKQMLLSRRMRLEAARLVEGVEYIELTTRRDFMDRFTHSLYF